MFEWRSAEDGGVGGWGGTDGWWRCLLCNQWADETHVVGQKHLKRLENSQAYLLHNNRGIPNSDKCSTPSMRCLPDGVNGPWQSCFSPAYNQTYYHNSETGESQWNKPRGFVLEASDSLADV